ncbi:MAG: putative metal-binding motif-containing protein [Deltaproteobacteria bacterium]|nr:putative metal-binding motif-containing protein [Deltaproteobacteria bacterium]
MNKMAWVGLVALAGVSLFACSDGGGSTDWDVPPDGTGDIDGGWDEGGGGDDVGPGDADDGDGGDDGSCVPTGDELCDGLDNDCDGETDEGFVLDTDPDNCGGCGLVCRPDHATGGCTGGDCVYTCEAGWVDADGSGVNGCEYECSGTATAESTSDGTCGDGLDNDCDGRTDATDADCATCIPELCNSADDDCDGLTDEDFDVDFDPANCGACGTVCAVRDHATAACVLGTCDVQCAAGWSDLDGNPVNGCEAECVPVSVPNEARCDGVDDDCDGAADEDFAGTPCGEGLCRRSSVCWRGVESACTPRTPPASVDVTCDGLDDDCDGVTDDDGSCECLADADCDDAIDCTLDTCVAGEGRCEHVADATSCSDGDICSGEEVCDIVLGCIAGTPIDCSDGIGCTDDLCNPLSGDCSWSLNHTLCTGTEICDPPRSAAPSGCAPAPTCATDPDCDDGDACNGVETCGGDLLCRAGTPVDCDDGRSCTSDLCNPADGSCAHLSPDVDGDTYTDAACDGTDCDDRAVGVHPGATEICDGLDQNCDTDPDAGALCPTVPHTSSASCLGALCIPNCLVGWGDCDGILANGCDTSLTTLANCGGCGVPCDLPRSSESCATGTCVITSCDTPWGDCNSTDADGCEASLTTLVNCGACGNPCAPDHATGATCITGACAFSGCGAGWGNCDGNGANGCERSLTTVTDCASCGVPCDLSNAAESCATGSCVLLSCNPNWGNCDGSQGNGCETSLTTAANCGVCGTPCDLANASESCSTGTCALTSCSTNWGNCDSVESNGCERSLVTLTDCAACGTPCNPANATGATCASGACNYASCNSGFGNCDSNPANGCEASLRTLLNCSVCGVPCDLPQATESCATGTCTLTACELGFGNCDTNPANGCEATLNTLLNCGNCGVACSPANATGPTCATGSCNYGSCVAGYQSCDSNPANGCERDIRTLTDCGGCGVTCDLANAAESCASGTCTLGLCNANWGNCDSNPANGCERTLTTLTSCGGCSTVCSPANASGATCATGTCDYATCTAGWENCDSNRANGCERNIRTLTDCGGCGVACNLNNASESCATGTCQITTCNAGWADVNGNPADGCECALEGGETYVNETCATAGSLGSIPEGVSTYSAIGKLTRAGDVDCYTFTAADTTPGGPGDIHHVNIHFTSNPGNQFQVTVYRGGCGAAVCSGLYTVGDSYEWFTDFDRAAGLGTPGGPPTGEGNCFGTAEPGFYDLNICTDSTSSYTFCVSRRSGSPSCDQYTVEYSNGAY